MCCWTSYILYFRSVLKSNRQNNNGSCTNIDPSVCIWIYTVSRNYSFKSFLLYSFVICKIILNSCLLKACIYASNYIKNIICVIVIIVNHSSSISYFNILFFLVSFLKYNNTFLNSNTYSWKIAWNYSCFSSCYIWASRYHIRNLTKCNYFTWIITKYKESGLLYLSDNKGRISTLFIRNIFFHILKLKS